MRSEGPITVVMRKEKSNLGTGAGRALLQALAVAAYPAGLAPTAGSL